VPIGIGINLPEIRYRTFDRCIKAASCLDRESLPQFGILMFEVLQMGNAAR
jgi:hypothetical protein